ncbi:RagB/SusD family nutrient uptake outer membrane protein [Leadbetterella byssophila]|uniref:RagB/SusD family nutrient uptake outer membrane protein n=1 Tax=Leadbetterella byssophila TaxID=316068 RepID=UPI00399F1651
MKRIYLSLLLTAGLTTSCSDVLNVEPEYVKDGNQIFTNLRDYEFALTGAYAQFRTVGYYGSGGQTTSTWGNLPDMMSDILAQTGDDLANWQNQSNWEYETNENDLEVAWLAAFGIISQANLTLRNIEQFSSTSPKAVNRIKGQALAIRGLVHFDLLRFWGESYGFNDSSKGIPFVDQVDIMQKPARLSVAESWTKIFKDLTEAETLLGDVDQAINSGTAKSYIDANAVRAILARANLYAGRYAEAENYASQVISAVPLATSKAAFESIWSDAGITEVLWKVPFSAGEGSPSSGLHNGPSNRNRFRPTSTALALYDQEADIRYAAYFTDRNAANGTPRKIVKKFLGRGAAIDNLVDWKAFRVAEQYLIRAEARALQNKTDLANADLNALRAARITGYTAKSYSGQELLNEVADERIRELIGEGHRFFDLKRTTKVVERKDPSQLASTVLTLPSSHRAWTWPIPQSEMDANDSMAGQQTTGY